MLKMKSNIFPTVGIHAMGRLVYEAVKGTLRNRMPPDHRLRVTGSVTRERV